MVPFPSLICSPETHFPSQAPQFCVIVCKRKRGESSVFISFVCIVDCNGWETRFMFLLSAFVLFCRTLILQQYCTSVPAPIGNVGSCLCSVVSFQISRTFILQRYSTSVVPLPTGIVVRRNVTAYAMGQYLYIAYCIRRGVVLSGP